MSEIAASPKYAGLDVLIRMEWDRLDDIIVGAKIMERAVLITKYFEGQRCCADGDIVSDDPCSRF